MSVVAPTLEQLRVLAVVAETGSFSAAAKRLRRSQPTISYIIANLEAQTGCSLFERSGRRPRLTGDGAALLVHARRLCLLSDELQAHLLGRKQGLEPELIIAVDVIFPADWLTQALKDFNQQFPSVSVRVQSEPMAAVVDALLEGRAHLGVSLLGINWPDEIASRQIGAIEIIPVAGPDHPMAGQTEPPPLAVVRQHLQVGLAERSKAAEEPKAMLNSVRLWRFCDPHSMLAVLRSGVGWGHMPRHLVEDDLRSGALVQLNLPIRPHGWYPCTLLHRSDVPPGPAGQWFMDRLVVLGGSRWPPMTRDRSTKAAPKTS
jgi:DNA-binding transcriptional LysR family regulator